MKNNSKVRDVRSLECKIKVLKGMSRELGNGLLGYSSADQRLRLRMYL